MSEAAIADPPRPGRWLQRLLSCIRFDEVIVLQGAPLIGMLFSIPHSAAKAATFLLGSLCLVAHVFTLNDWAGIQDDLNDRNRSARTFHAKGVNRNAIGVLAAALLVLSLMLFGLLGAAPFIVAAAIVTLSALYSAPILNMKGRPVFGSVLHFIGGTLHFLLGYAAFSTVDARGVAIGCFFGLVFSAGHLTHETRDCDSDQLNGVQTNAVVFGKKRCFLASVAVFTGAYALLVTLAVCNVVPRALVLSGVLYPVQFYASFRALRANLSFTSLRQLQWCYRLLYAVIGAAMAVTSPAVLMNW